MVNKVVVAASGIYSNYAGWFYHQQIISEVPFIAEVNLVDPSTSWLSESGGKVEVEDENEAEINGFDANAGEVPGSTPASVGPKTSFPCPLCIASVVVAAFGWKFE